MNIVITGASRGIGKALAEIFHQHGHCVVICSRDEHKWDALPAEIIKFKCDISIKSDVKDFAAFVLKTFDKVDVLINNGGVFIPRKLTEEDDSVLPHLIETNLYSAYYLTKALLPNFISNQKGFIFNMCSVASLQAYPSGGSYSISKFALLGFSKALREELKAYNIKVTSVLPGATYTDSWAETNLPESRFGKAEDVAKLVYDITQLSSFSVVEDIVIRPQLGDI